MNARQRISGIVAVALLATAAASVRAADAPTKLFKSEAQIIFSPIRPTMAQVDFSALSDNFKEYVTEQVAIIGSGRQVNLALQEDAWKATGKGSSDALAADFRSKLIVERTAGMVTITCADEDEATAQAAIKAVVAAYKKFYDEDSPDVAQTILKIMESDRASLENDSQKLSEQTQKVCGKDSILTPESLERYYNAQLDDLSKAESALLAAQIHAEATEKLEAIVEKAKMQVRDLAAKVMQLHKLKEQVDDTKMRLDLLNAKYDHLMDAYQFSVRAHFLSDGDKAGQGLFQFKDGHWMKAAQ